MSTLRKPKKRVKQTKTKSTERPIPYTPTPAPSKAEAEASCLRLSRNAAPPVHESSIGDLIRLALGADNSPDVGADLLESIDRDLHFYQCALHSDECVPLERARADYLFAVACRARAGAELVRRLARANAKEVA